MKRTKPPKQKMVRSKFNGIAYKPSYLEKVVNPGSMPGKWNKSMGALAMFFASEGLTEKEISVKLNVHECTISYWKRTKPEFLESLQKGKLVYTLRVERSLIESAVGYSHPDNDIRVVDGEIVITPITKHYPPNVTAQIFYLKNRARDRWMDVHKFEGQINHNHLLDLTNKTNEELQILKTIGLVELPEHDGSDTD